MDNNSLVNAIIKMEAIKLETNNKYIIVLARSNFHFPHLLLTIIYNNIHFIEVLL